MNPNCIELEFQLNSNSVHPNTPLCHLSSRIWRSITRHQGVAKIHRPPYITQMGDEYHMYYSSMYYKYIDEDIKVKTNPWTVLRPGCFCHPSKEAPWYDRTILKVTLAHLPALPLVGASTNSHLLKASRLSASWWIGDLCEESSPISLLMTILKHPHEMNLF